MKRQIKKTPPSKLSTYRASLSSAPPCTLFPHVEKSKTSLDNCSWEGFSELSIKTALHQNQNFLAALCSCINKSTNRSPFLCVQWFVHGCCSSLSSYHGGRKKAPSGPLGASLSRTPVCCCVSLCSTALQSARRLIT